MVPKTRKKTSRALYRKQLTMLTLMVALAFALYLNWNYSGAGQSFDTTGLLSETSADAEYQKNYGDAKYVSADPDYFSEVRLSRSQSRDQSLEDLQDVLASSTLSDEEKAEASEKLAAITAYGVQESAIEGLVKAKGFSDCVAFISESGVKVVVPSPGLTDAEAAQILEIVVSETGLPASAVSILEVN